jgi:hypothetical protein
VVGLAILTKKFRCSTFFFFAAFFFFLAYSSKQTILKEKHVLERNELAEIFHQSLDSNGQVKWRILHDEIVMDSDHGRTLIQFVAQRV